jgi:nucleoside phosphorylase
MSALVYLAPLRLEQAMIRRGAPGYDVQRIGMGPVRARRSATVLKRQLADRTVIVMGLAGGLRAERAVGDVIVASSVCDENGERIELPLVDAILDQFARAGSVAHRAPVVSSTKIVRGLDARRQLSALGDVVDMESFWCAKALGASRVAVVRVVSDTAEHELVSTHLLTNGARSLARLKQAAKALSSLAPVTLPEAVHEKAGDR